MNEWISNTHFMFHNTASIFCNYISKQIFRHDKWVKRIFFVTFTWLIQAGCNSISLLSLFFYKRLIKLYSPFGGLNVNVTTVRFSICVADDRCCGFRPGILVQISRMETDAPQQTRFYPASRASFCVEEVKGGSRLAGLQDSSCEKGILLNCSGAILH
jgi:hypothetical protein